MAKKKNNTQSNIDSNELEIVCVDTKIKLSDEYLRRLLSNVYEIARKDAKRINFAKSYGIFFSIALTLLLALITSEFKSIGAITSNIVRIIAIIICSCSFIMGCVLLAIYIRNKDLSVTEERDKAIEEVMNQIKD